VIDRASGTGNASYTRAAHMLRDAHFRLILDLYDASHRRATLHPASPEKANPSVPEHVDRIAAAF
jgi:hypothetical protein